LECFAEKGLRFSEVNIALPNRVKTSFTSVGNSVDSRRRTV
jgi:hypothetical protein